MKFKSALLTALLAGFTLTSQFAEAHPPGHRWHGHGGARIYFGAPYPYHPYPYRAYPYPYPYVYSPPVIVTQPPQPQVYIEQGNGRTTAPVPAPTAPSANAGTQNDAFWYYCEQADSYYPYVKECPAGWQRVAPTPPAAASN